MPPPRRTVARVLRGGALAAFAAGMLALWAHVSLPEHEVHPAVAHAGAQLGRRAQGGGVPPATRDAGRPGDASAGGDAVPGAPVASSCHLRCGTDATVVLPGSVGKCGCDAASCDGRGAAEGDACCRSYRKHCTATSDSLRPSPPTPKPRPFPPLHHGPELVYLDAVVVFCQSMQNHVRHVGVKELVEWFEHMRHGGVGRLLLYDCGPPGEPIARHPDLVPYVEEGYVKVTPWDSAAFGVPEAEASNSAVAAVAADAHRRFGPHASVWRAVLGPTEYPVVVGDAEAGALTRWLAQLRAGAAVVGVAVAGGQHTGQAQAADRRALRYEWQTPGVVKGEERYFVRPKLATGYGGRCVASLMPVVAADPASVRVVRVDGPVVVPGRPAPCYMYRSGAAVALSVGAVRDASERSCVAMERVSGAGDVLGSTSAGAARLADSGALFPGIPSRLLRKRLAATWPFRDLYADEGPQAADAARRAWFQLRDRSALPERPAPAESAGVIHVDGDNAAARSHESVAVAGGLSRAFDELHAVEWPPRDWAG